MVKHKWACIINPVAGNHYPEKNINYIKDKLLSFKRDMPIHFTKEPGHGAIIAGELIEQGYDTILVVGGDGTVHEVGSVLVDQKHVVMGIISGGTGNDYNYMAGFPEHFEDVHWDSLFSRNITAFDVGLCNKQFFFNGMGIGFDATMSAESQADRVQTGKSGKGRYTWIILKTLLGYKELHRNMSIDMESRKVQSFLTTVAIGRRFAGSYHLTPKAIADDGLLDICDIKPLRLFQRLNILLKVPGGSHLKHKSVNYYTCKTCSFEFEQIVPAHLDGEIIFDKSFDVSIKNKSLNVITNF